MEYLLRANIKNDQCFSVLLAGNPRDWLSLATIFFIFIFFNIKNKNKNNPTLSSVSKQQLVSPKIEKQRKLDFLYIMYQRFQRKTNIDVTM